MLEQPGPPLNQAANGAVFGFFLDSKNQNHMFILLPTDRYPLYCFTPGVVSHSPVAPPTAETYSIVDCVSACSNMVTDAPFRFIIVVLELRGIVFSNSAEAVPANANANAQFREPKTRIAKLPRGMTSKKMGRAVDERRRSKELRVIRGTRARRTT